MYHCIKGDEERRVRRATANVGPCLSNTEFSLNKGVHCMREELPTFAISTMVSEQMPMSFGNQLQWKEEDQRWSST